MYVKLINTHIKNIFYLNNNNLCVELLIFAYKIHSLIYHLSFNAIQYL
jgi:hypothetical protein